MRKFPIAILVLLLAGCESFPDWPLFARSSEMASPSRYNFDWILSGSRAVGPVQVFDNGSQMWLQFAEGAPIPAIFSRSSRGDAPLAYRREGPYVVVDRVWPMLVLRGGRLEGIVQRAALRASGTTTQVPVEPEQAALPGPHPPAAGANADSPGREVGATVQREESKTRQPVPMPGRRSGTTGRQSHAAPAPVPGTAVVSHPPPAAAMPVPQAAPAPGTPPAAVDAASALPVSSLGAAGPGGAPASFEISPSDRNIRRALGRWARTAGWTFNAEHWAVNVDVPVVGSARFDSEFKPAVLALLASTELGDRPLRPCFYSNKVVRVVPYAQVCDRTRNPAGAS